MSCFSGRGPLYGRDVSQGWGGSATMLWFLSAAEEYSVHVGITGTLVDLVPGLNCMTWGQEP